MIRPPIIPMGVMILLILAILVPLWAGVAAKPGLRRHFPHAALVTAILACLFLVNSRPMTEEKKANVEAKNVDVLFVLDDTMSMYAEDYTGGKPRMAGARAACGKIMQDLDGANFAVIKFNNISQVMAPFTQDVDSVTDALDAIESPSSSYARGTSLNTPHDDMKKLLESSAKKPGRMQVVFYLSDGEITDGSELADFRDLSGLTDGGAVLGFGTADGAEVPEADGGYVWDYEGGGYAVSKLDEATLRKLAAELGVDYIHAENADAAGYVDQEVLRTAETTVENSDKVVVYNDRYYIYLRPMLGLMAAELFLVIFGDRFLWRKRR